MSASLTERMARFVVDIREVSDAALATATNAFIDTIGCSLAGTREPAAVLARDWAAHLGARPVAIWGTTQRGAATEAALANGIAAHAHDYVDSHYTLRAHPSTTLVPTVLAWGEAEGCSGRDALRA